MDGIMLGFYDVTDKKVCIRRILSKSDVDWMGILV
jgi:hypothetical protein